MTEQTAGRRLGTQRGPCLTKLVEGEPLLVDGRELVPLVRVTSRVRRQASLYGEGVGAQGYGLVRMRPVAILDRGENGRFDPERYEIRNETARTIGWLALAALIMPCLALLFIYLSRRLGSR